jgi:hypothetical protein
MNYQNLVSLNKNQSIYNTNIFKFLKTTVFSKCTKPFND